MSLLITPINLETVRNPHEFASFLSVYHLTSFFVFFASFPLAAVPQQYEDNHALGIWVNKQRMEMKAFADQGRTSMTQRRMQLLEKIDFEWAKPKGVAAWDQKFRELQEYKAIHGDCK